MAISICAVDINLAVESVTRKGREVCYEPSQFHGHLTFMEGIKMEKGKVKPYRTGGGEEPTLTEYRSMIEVRIKAPLELAFSILTEEAGCLGDDGDGAMAVIGTTLLLWNLIEEQVGEDIRRAYEAKKKPATIPAGQKGRA